MIDGIELADVAHVVALGSPSTARSLPLSLRVGSSENATVATALLADLVDRAPRFTEEQLYMLDGANELDVRDLAALDHTEQEGG